VASTDEVETGARKKWRPKAACLGEGTAALEGFETTSLREWDKAQQEAAVMIERVSGLLLGPVIEGFAEIRRPRAS